MVPGDYPQVEQDLAQFPSPVLDLLDSYGVKVAVLDHGQTLADSPALRHLSESEYQLERDKAKQITHRAFEQTEAQTFLEFAESTTRELRKAGLDFHFAVSSQEPSLKDIAARQDISVEHFEDWSKAFQDLNQGLPRGLYLLPHIYDQGQPIPENRLRSARETTAEYVEASLGLNRPEDRLVLVHQKFTEAMAEEVGNYRLVTHEMGHALDHVLDRTTGVPGFGQLHRQTVDALYGADLKKAEAAGVAATFTTDRASENVREYFAEAVEAYLTFPKDDGGDFFRAGNSNPGLRSKNPELYGYMEQIFSTDFSVAKIPDPPGRPLLPDFVPDPDAAVIQL
jgi:Glucose-regulated metallo-peptidase M90